jgi:hypothetical protein
MSHAYTVNVRKKAHALMGQKSLYKTIYKKINLIVYGKWCAFEI